jgi:hypothetical protein
MPPQYDSKQESSPEVQRLQSGSESEPDLSDSGEAIDIKKRLRTKEESQRPKKRKKNRMCVHPGCKKQPSFGKEGEKKPKHCSEHKDDDDVDVVHPRCVHPGCKKQPCFGKEDGKAKHCFEHKDDDEGDLKNARCVHPGCKRRSSFGKEGEKKPKHCFEHKDDDEVDVVSPRCSRTDVHLDLAPRAYYKVKGDPLCPFCFTCMWPELAKRQVRQEHLILAEIQRRVPELWNYFVVWDCRVPNSCTLKRPDLLYETRLWYLHFEVDEHTRGPHEDHRGRLAEIQQHAMGDRPGLVIRINPNGRPAMLRLTQTSTGNVWWSATKHFERLMDEVEAKVRQMAVPFLESENKYAETRGPRVVKMFF